MTNLLRRAELREPDGAVACEKGAHSFRMVLWRKISWNTQDWIDCFRKGTNQTRFEHSVNSLGRIQWACQGHSGGVRVDAKLQSNVGILHRWTERIDHVGASWEMQVYSLEEPMATKRKHRCFFTSGNGTTAQFLVQSDTCAR